MADAQFITPALIGVLFGGAVTTLSTVLTHIFTSKKELKIFEKQQKANDVEFDRKQIISEKEKLDDIYTRSLKNLSVVISENKNRTSNDEDNSVSDAAKESFSSVASLIAIKPSDHLTNCFDDFVNSPDHTYYCEELRTAILSSLVNKPVIDDKNTNDLNTYTLHLDFNFRKEKAIEGIELKQSYNIEFSFLDLTSENRKFFVSLFSLEHNLLPKQVKLGLPFYHAHTNKILDNYDNWKADINPDESSLNEIFNIWKITYELRHTTEQEKITC